MKTKTFHPASLDPSIMKEPGAPPIPGATWYRTDRYDTGLHYALGKGFLNAFAWLTCDLFLDGLDHAVFRVVLTDSQSGRRFAYRFGLLNQVGARLRLPLAAVDQSRWQTGREAALLKPMCSGDPVDMALVDSMDFMVDAKGDESLHFCMTPLTATTSEPARMTQPVLPAGPLTDEMGQHRLRRWPTRSTSVTEVTARLQEQWAQAASARMPEGTSAWGGWLAKRHEATGFFRTHHDGNRWWLIDPDGYIFWSMGVDCVRSQVQFFLNDLESAYAWLPERDGPFAPAYYPGLPPHDHLQFVDFMRVNLIRAFGADWYPRWADLALAALRRLGFNTVANWSEWPIASASRVPYVRPLSPAKGFEHVPMVFRDFPDVFHAAFPGACEAYARQLDETRDDPAMIGYFLMNEPKWGFAGMSPAEGMLRNAAAGPGRTALADWMLHQYGSEQAISTAWGMPVNRTLLQSGTWTQPLTGAAKQDMHAFSAIMVEKQFRTLSEACRAADPNHLNLGARYYTAPPDWMSNAMRHFDVFSINCYKDQFPGDAITALYDQVQVPIMIGEWHFGSLDAGLPGGCLRRVRSQHDRGEAYRVYAEGALSHPACVGAHWFTLYDESPMGRFDGDNWNTGFFDICHRPYEPLTTAARVTHERLYDIASGRIPPYTSHVAYQRSNIL